MKIIQYSKGRDKPMTKVTELAIRARAAVQYPGWRVDFVGPATIALTHVMGRERVIEVRATQKAAGTVP